MSFSDADKPFQSAQHPLDQTYAEEDQIGSSSVDSSDAADLDEHVHIEPLLHISGSSPAADKSESILPALDPEEVETSSEERSPKSNSVPSRPNKFSGPPSTWRNWTAPERDLAASLDQLTAKDLSIHLYNAFMLEKRRHIQGWPQRVELPGANNDQLGDDSTWTLPKSWTAWPLAPEGVPREEEGRRWEDATTLPKGSPVTASRSAEVLRELLVGQILRKARARFLEREPEDPDLEAPTSNDTAKGSPESNAGRGTEPFKPVVMADDERATQVLQPTVQHIMTKIDDLLIGLHHARSSYVNINHATSDSESQIIQRSASRPSVGKRKRYASTHKANVDIDSSDTPATSETEDASTRHTTSRSRSQSKRPKPTSRKTGSRNLRNRLYRMGCRDWSDVLGIASMVAWPPNVVERTAARCASLFGEGITFRTLEEGSTAFTERSYLPDLLQPLAVNRDKTARSCRHVNVVRKDEGEMVGGVHVDGFLQPIEGKKSWKYPKASKQRVSTG